MTMVSAEKIEEIENLSRENDIQIRFIRRDIKDLLEGAKSLKFSAEKSLSIANTAMSLAQKAADDNDKRLKPIEQIIYGGIKLTLVTVTLAILALVIRQQI